MNEKRGHVVLEPGLDLHERETRWQELRPRQPCRRRRGGSGHRPDFLAARELAAACQAGTASPGDIAAALENLSEIHDLVEDLRPL
jgi:hypothetical protein